MAGRALSCCSCSAGWDGMGWNGMGWNGTSRPAPCSSRPLAGGRAMRCPTGGQSLGASGAPAPSTSRGWDHPGLHGQGEQFLLSKSPSWFSKTEKSGPKWLLFYLNFWLFIPEPLLTFYNFFSYKFSSLHNRLLCRNSCSAQTALQTELHLLG